VAIRRERFSFFFSLYFFLSELNDEDGEDAELVHCDGRSVWFFSFLPFFPFSSSCVYGWMG